MIIDELYLKETPLRLLNEMKKALWLLKPRSALSLSLTSWRQSEPHSTFSSAEEDPQRLIESWLLGLIINHRLTYFPSFFFLSLAHYTAASTPWFHSAFPWFQKSSSSGFTAQCCYPCGLPCFSFLSMRKVAPSYDKCRKGFALTQKFLHVSVYTQLAGHAYHMCAWAGLFSRRYTYLKPRRKFTGKFSWFYLLRISWSQERFFWPENSWSLDLWRT